MSYSRWSADVWYVYWDWASGSTRDMQVCSVHRAGGGSWRVFGDETSESAADRICADAQQVTPDERARLVGYLAEWLADVAEQYPGVSRG